MGTTSDSIGISAGFRYSAVVSLYSAHTRTIEGPLLLYCETECYSNSI